jgi:hypothetical protein
MACSASNQVAGSLRSAAGVIERAIPGSPGAGGQLHRELPQVDHDDGSERSVLPGDRLRPGSPRVGSLQRDVRPDAALNDGVHRPGAEQVVRARAEPAGQVAHPERHPQRGGPIEPGGSGDARETP